MVVIANGVNEGKFWRSREHHGGRFLERQRYDRESGGVTIGTLQGFQKFIKKRK